MRWHHVLVAADGAGPAQHAITVAGELAKELDFRMTVVTVLGDGQLVPASLHRHVPLILRGHPGIEIPRAAEQKGADLIILGRCALRNLGKPWLGTTSEAVVRRSQIPCLLIPEGQRDFSYVTAALDGTERGFAVLDVALAASRLFGADLEIVTVEPTSLEAHVPAVPEARTLRVAAELQQRALHTVLPPLQVRHGEPAVAVQEQLNHPGSDLLILGARRGGPRGLPPDSSGAGRMILHQVRSAVLTVPL